MGHDDELYMDTRDRYEYLRELERLKVALPGAYLAALDPADQPPGYSFEDFEISSDLLDIFRTDDVVASGPSFQAGLEACSAFDDYVSNLIGKIGEYSLGWMMDNETFLCANTDEGELLLEYDPLPYPRTEPGEPRYRKQFVGNPGVKSQPDLEVTKEDKRAVDVAIGRVHNVLSRMSPSDISVE